MKLPILKSSDVQKPSKGQSTLYINEDDKKLYSLDYNGNILRFEKDFPIDIKNVTISNNNVVLKGNFFIGKNNAGEFELFEGNVENHGNVEITLSNSEQTLNSGYYESIIIPAKPEETLPEIFNGPYTVTENGTLNTKDKMLDNNIVINVPETDLSNITPENIKADVYIAAIDAKGTFTADATATAADILKGKTAGINGQMIVGTYEPSTSSDNQPGIPTGKRAFSIAGVEGEFADINGVYIEETYTTSGSVWKHSSNEYITFKESGSDIGDAEYEQWYYEIDRGDDKKFINYYIEEGIKRIDYPFTGFETQSNLENGSFKWNIHIEMNNEYAGGDYDGELEYKLTFSEVSNSSSDSSSNSLNFYKCISVNISAKTWSGYKVVLTNGFYSFEEMITEGLSYGNAFTPNINVIYNADATIIVSAINQKIDPIILNDTNCLIYIDGSSLTNQALAENKHEVTFGNGVSLKDGYINISNDQSGQILTTAKSDGYGGVLNTWTWDYYFMSDGSILDCSGDSTKGWTLEGIPGQSLYFRGYKLNNQLLNVTYNQNELIGLSMQYEYGTLHVWNKGKYVGFCTPKFENCSGSSFSIGCVADAAGAIDYERMADKIKLFRFSNIPRYTPGQDFELPEGFEDCSETPSETSQGIKVNFKNTDSGANGDYFLIDETSTGENRIFQCINDIGVWQILYTKLWGMNTWVISLHELTNPEYSNDYQEGAFFYIDVEESADSASITANSTIEEICNVTWWFTITSESLSEHPQII